MSKGSAKRIHASNQSTLKRLFAFIIITLVVGIVGCGWRWSPLFMPSDSTSLWALLGTGSLSLLSYWQLRSLGASQLSNDGRLERSGYDLEAPGLHQYIIDYIYITGAVHMLLPLTRRAWLLFLFIPAYCLYLLLKYLKKNK